MNPTHSYLGMFADACNTVARHASSWDVIHVEILYFILSKFALQHAMKAQKGSKGIAVLIHSVITLALERGGCQCHILATLFTVQEAGWARGLF